MRSDELRAAFEKWLLENYPLPDEVGEVMGASYTFETFVIPLVETLRWLSGDDDEKPYCTYYERYLDDETTVPPYHEIAEKALADLQKKLGKK